MRDDAQRPTEPVATAGPAGPAEPDASSELRLSAWRRAVVQLDRRWQLALAFLLVVAMSLALGLLAGTFWGGPPEPPLVALGLTDAESEASAEVGSGQDAEPLDPEQQVFAERREHDLATRQEASSTHSTGLEFTDHALVRELAGAWRLDLGGGRRGYDVTFGADAVRQVHRQRFDVTLYDAEGAGLPPFYTVLKLPDGTLLAFLDAAGTFRLVLEEVSREPDGRLSWRAPSGDRRYGRRLSGESPWRSDR